MRLRGYGAAALLASAALWRMPVPPVVHAQAKPSEDQVKAAYLLNFGKFVRRTANDAQPASFDICLMGQDAVGSVLEKISLGERVNERPVRVVKLENTAAARTCAIVFIGASEAGRVDADLAALRATDALTVSGQPDFLKRGGMLEFMLQSNRVRFGVNLDAVNHANIQLSSELLKVAASVTGSSRREVGQ